MSGYGGDGGREGRRRRVAMLRLRYFALGSGEDAIKDGRYHSKILSSAGSGAPIGNRYGWSLCAEGSQREIVSVVIWLVVVEKVERGK